jgi:hypothetical protein
MELVAIGIAVFIGLAILGACLSIIVMAFAFLFWLASIPLKLVGIMPGIWWGD